MIRIKVEEEEMDSKLIYGEIIYDFGMNGRWNEAARNTWT
jgi:hypothetical protein